MNLLPTLTIAENLYLSHLPSAGGWIRRGRLRAMAREAMARIGLGELDPDVPVERLGIGHQQKVAAFVFAGLMSGLAALFQVARLEAADPNAGIGAELKRGG